MRIWSLTLMLINITNGELSFVREKDFDKIRLGKEGYEKVKTIHYNWYLHSIKAIICQMGKDILEKLDTKSRRQFLRCLSVIVDKRDIVSAARCLIAAKESLHDGGAKAMGHRGDALSSSLGNPAFTRIEKSFVQERTGLIKPQKEKPKLKKKTGIKMSVLKVKPIKRRLNIKKISRRNRMINRLHMRPTTNNKMRFRSYRSRRIKRSPYRLVADDIASKTSSNRFKVLHMDKVPSLLPRGEKSVVKRVTGLITTLLRKGNDSSTSDRKSKWMDSYKHLLKIKKALDEQAKKPGARVYDLRMFDLVVGNSKPTRAKGEKPILPPLIRDAYKLIRMLEGKPKRGDDSSNIKFLSPRFGAIMSDKNEIKGSLSPSILSFYKDNNEEQLLPIPELKCDVGDKWNELYSLPTRTVTAAAPFVTLLSLIDATGLAEKDRENVLETVMEIAGARQVIDDAFKILSSTELLGMRGELEDVTEKMIKMFMKMEKTFTTKQKNDMKRRGFTFLETNQLKGLHNHRELAKHGNELPFNITEYGNLSHSEREEALWLRVAEIAANGTKKRTKRGFTVLSVLKPIVLEPYMFSPVYGLTVLGPTVLSPSLFSPLILNPSVLSPFVLSPAIAMPFILSPYVFSPYVLSPLVMAPFILTPYVLSPNVINPYVLSPLILSPLVLCPDVLSPMVLGGSVLSPGVLSPAVLSKSFLMASVLSPTVLS